MMSLFELIYFLGYSAKKYYSFRNQRRLSFKVISIGNITVGGTGKTPAVVALANYLKNKGLYPIVLTRGYKGKAKGPCFVENRTPSENYPAYMFFGDEPLLISEKLKDVPVVKCADRYEGGMYAIENLKIQMPNPELLFILDDGFQHWKLYRDKNILLVDAENPFGNRKLLPMGILREPLKEIKRADIILITKKRHIEEESLNLLIDEIKTFNPDAGIFFSEHKPVSFVKQSGETLPLDWAKDKNLFALCAIANPESFKKTLTSLGSSIKAVSPYRDHYEFKQTDIDINVKEAEQCRADWLVTTEKDMIRLRHLRLPENLIALSIELSADREFFEQALN